MAISPVQEFVNNFTAYENKKSGLLEAIKKSAHAPIRLKKKTASNLFRYSNQDSKNSKALAIHQFDEVIAIDLEKGLLDVEGLASYEKIVNFTLKHGFLPTVAPELKHITIGGAIVGIGIESTCYQHGFVHDGLLEAEVLLPDGRIVLCNAHNEQADLFAALPNSYGTLGYILRAKIKLYPAKPWVHMKVKRFSNPALYLEAMKSAVDDTSIQFIEGLVFSKRELYLLSSQFVAGSLAPQQVDDIYRQSIFYRLVQNKEDVFLSTDDYIFRYDPDWFWNIPETPIYNFLRRVAPKSWRSSGVYKKYIDFKNKHLSKFGLKSGREQRKEPLIQDWEVPWDKAENLLLFALDHIDLQGRPWCALPIKPRRAATLYPLKPDTLYFNLGCYCLVEKKQGETDPYYYTKIMDTKCFELGGLKMLYSSTLLSAEQFSNLYNGKAYNQLKLKYDPGNLARNLYDKVALNPPL